ncbi:hypothetical protein N7462_008434 [Penicillium macrosclerotiorum]|uniref:uncharacterized protein n=1 Tax=Penicillium macrosclerotiorum TaxID=303699 RepID=UPI0025493979|nr:uncharacterized protein N7462_008434 [Penicillium macrosclerotiorum]KAJ5675537.1 hypothetical protein N7462_008434 [Penicillium macrosclerotiorum]
MDLRTIMNTDAGGASNRPPATPSSSSPTDASHQQRAQQPFPDYTGRPSQPPLQRPHASPDRSSSFGPVGSPYQQFNAPPPINTAVQSQRSQSPSHVSTPYPGARDTYGGSGYNAHQQSSAGPLTSPYTPQQSLSAGSQQSEHQSYFAQQRSHSLHSVVTNPRAAGDAFHTQDSPPSTSQPLPPHQFSPSAHRSVPGTPLGPPPTFSSRQSPSSGRPRSSGHDSVHNPLSSPQAALEAQGREPTKTQSPSASRQFATASRPSEPTSQFHSSSVQQEQPDITSPKVFSRQNSTAATSDSRGSPVATGNPHINSSPSAQRSSSHPLKMEVDHELTGHSENQPPKPKRMRYNEPPIYAQRSTRTKGVCPPIQNPQPLVSKQERRLNQDAWASRRQSLTSAPRSATTPRTARTPGPPGPPPGPPPVSKNGPPSQPPAPSAEPVGGLGPWEPSISGFIPHEEITKMLCDFLFKHVVLSKDVAVGPAGSAAVGQGAIIEIEAKLGHVIDMDRRERLRLPILTESVIDRDNSGFRTSFESRMTIEQHRAMNNFLNEAVKGSISVTDPNRIPISYAHKKERDTFYEVSSDDLPPIIRQNLNRRHTPKVRVTTDQQTGEVIAKIVKCRVADMDVCSPRTVVDWRVSVNLEMEYDGDISHLSPVDTSKGGRGERNKDRMSYRHLAYQIDLTQVASADHPTKNDFEHELEIEVSAAEVKRQGQLAMTGNPKNQYEELVKGFVDNIRLLARAVPG